MLEWVLDSGSSSTHEAGSSTKAKQESIFRQNGYGHGTLTKLLQDLPAFSQALAAAAPGSPPLSLNQVSALSR
jgi:hypothetical protein